MKDFHGRMINLYELELDFFFLNQGIIGSLLSATLLVPLRSNIKAVHGVMQSDHHGIMHGSNYSDMQSPPPGTQQPEETWILAISANLARAKWAGTRPVAFGPA
jgi:hypothetical protein